MGDTVRNKWRVRKRDNDEEATWRVTENPIESWMQWKT